MASWYDLQDTFHRDNDNWWRRFLKGLNNAFNPNHAWFDYDDMAENGSGLENLLGSIGKKYAGTGLTDAEKEANAFSAEEAQKSRDFTEYMTRNKYQMETQSMEQAGINPAMVYGGGSLVPTSSNGAAASSVTPDTAGIGGLVDLIQSLVRFPKELDALRASIDERRSQAQLNRELGMAALKNADTNARGASVQERLATVQEYRADIENELKDWKIQFENKQLDEIAARAKNLDEQTRLMERQVTVAERNASSSEKQAIASLRSSLAAARNAATNEKVGLAQKSLYEAQAILTGYNSDAKSIINRYLDDRQKQELSNLEKEGFKLDAQGRLIDKQGNLATAQQVYLYTNAACNVSNAVNRWVNPLSGIGKSSNIGPVDFLSGYESSLPDYGTFYQP